MSHQRVACCHWRSLANLRCISLFSITTIFSRCASAGANCSGRVTAMTVAFAVKVDWTWARNDTWWILGSPLTIQNVPGCCCPAARRANVPHGGHVPNERVPPFPRYVGCVAVGRCTNGFQGPPCAPGPASVLPSFTPRALAATSAAFVRVPIIARLFLIKRPRTGEE